MTEMRRRSVLLRLFLLAAALLVVSSPPPVVANFDYVMLTAINHDAVCRAFADAGGGCRILATAPVWTLHGLWPNYDNGSYPQHCSSERFDRRQVATILEPLERDWPNLYLGQQESSLWAHEWEKHGTCAAEWKQFGSQLLYFNTTLALLHRLDIWKSLASAGTPSRDAPYSYDELLSSARGALTSGRQVQIHCVHDVESGQFLLGDIRVCIDRNFNFLNCPSVPPTNGKPYSRHRSQSPNRHGGKPRPPDFVRCPANAIYYYHAATATNRVASGTGNGIGDFFAVRNFSATVELGVFLTVVLLVFQFRN